MKRTEDFVCPLPPVWAKIHARLCAIAKERCIPAPPMPLILAAWDVPALAKLLRWNETIEWADRYSLKGEIPVLREEDGFYIGN